MAGQNPNGSPLPSNPDTDGSPYTDAGDAYAFAAANDPCAGDSPNFSTSGEGGGKMTLAQQYEFFWIWCWIIYSIGREEFAKIKTPREMANYDRRLNAASPALHRAIAGKTEKSLLDLRRDVRSEVSKILADAL